jgi:3D (Asp-Asp-Asp) domain-containing protein
MWRGALWVLLLGCPLGCATAGSAWMAEPLPGEGEEAWAPPGPQPAEAAGRPRTSRTILIQESGSPQPDEPPESGAAPKLDGRSLGSFRNTYYDFPSEDEHKGSPVALKNPKCKTIADVPRGFHDAVCVQGSGTLRSGVTVSFAKRDCECAEVCPRTGQKICFDELDRAKFPWGRGATGKPITPLLTVAVDSDVIPLGTPLYIPEFDGLPRDLDQSASHDGCFIAQDRGMKIKGQHVDVFTGHESITKLWNRLVPSNKGVTIVLDSPRCARAGESQLP